MVLIAMGRVGSGKSTLARSLAHELGWEVFSSDRIRKELAGVPLYVRGSEAERRRLYTKSMTDKTYATMTRSALAEARLRAGAILDATFSSKRRRDTLRRAIARAGLDYCFIETQVPTSTIRKRLTERARSTTEISDARLENFAMLDGGYQPPAELEPRHCISAKTARNSEAVAVAALKILALRRTRNGAAS
jgi:predicted kinase